MPALPFHEIEKKMHEGVGGGGDGRQRNRAPRDDTVTDTERLVLAHSREIEKCTVSALKGAGSYSACTLRSARTWPQG